MSATTAPAPPVEPLVSRLEKERVPRIAYQDALTTFWCGDNRDWLPMVADGSIDLIITSPPFNLGSSTGGGFRRTKDGTPTGKTNRWRAERGWGTRKFDKAYGGAEGGAVYGAFDDALPWPEYEAQQAAVLRECWRVLSDRGALFYHHKPHIQAGEVRFPQRYFDAAGVPVRQVIVWDRQGGMNFQDSYYLPMHEYVLLAAKPGFALKRGAVGAGQGDVWRFIPERNNDHPAPFPLALPRRVLHSIASPVALGGDPYTGSGTTAVACREVGIPFVGCEINPGRPFLAYAIERVTCRQGGFRLDVLGTEEGVRRTGTDGAVLPAGAGVQGALPLEVGA